MFSLRKLLKDVLLRLAPIYHSFLVCKLRHSKQINVVFFAMSVSMWRYQSLYEQLRQNSRFNVMVVIMPCATYSQSQQLKDEKELQEYFNSKHVDYVLGKVDSIIIDIRRQLKPDILFYPQPYNGYYPRSVSYNAFYDKLLCYVPYAFWTSKDEWSYNQPLHKVAWKLFYSTDLHKKDAKRYSFRKDKNVEVVGYPNADEFMFREHSDVWKVQHGDKPKKRIIWAPHFTINSGGPLFQSNFLWMSEVMIRIAQEYKEHIQIAFKPHPRLYTELCEHKDWGALRTQEYYALWAEMENTQLETTGFVDLFMTSDAMIHDSSSFCVEYLYTRNPVLYIATDYERQYNEKNELGKIALSNHYVGLNENDIIKFVEQTVCGGVDPMRENRNDFVTRWLLPPNDKSFSQNTLDVLLNNLS